MAGTKLDDRQVVNRSALSMVGSAANDTLDTIFPKIDAELAKLFEDRNITLVDGGVITIPSAGTSVTFTQALKLHVNSQVTGGTPTVIDLGSTTRTLSTNLKMIYAVINRTAGTAVVTDDASSLPTQTSANQEVVLIAKRIDSADGTKTIYFRNGMTIVAGQSARLGSPSALDSSFTIGDATDPTKQIGFDAAGTTGTKTTLTSSQTTNRVLTLPDITDTIVTRTNSEALLGKQLSFSVSNDGTTTGSNATTASFSSGVLRLTNSSLVSLSGIPSGNIGQFLVLENKTGNQITINNEEGTATAANRIQTGTGANISMPNNATFAFTYDTTSARWQLTGGSGSGNGSGTGKNYLSSVTTSQSATPNTGNGNFELGATTGWSLAHTTLSSGVPNQASGSWTAASGNLSFSAVTSGRIAGSYSGSLVSSAASTAGDMLVSDAFNIDLEDQAKPLTFKAYYSPTVNPTNLNFSGTSSNTLQFYIYDVTNGTWIQPAGVYGMTQGSGVGYVTGTFQTTSNSTQYRLAVVNINASAGAFTMLFDDFFVGPQTAPLGVPVTDWQSYTPTMATGSGSITNAAATGFWRRVGDELEVRGQVLFSGTSAAFNALLLSYPSGLSANGAKLTSAGDNRPLGTATFVDSAVQAYGLGYTSYHSTTQVTVQFSHIVTHTGDVPTLGNPITNTAPFTFSTNDIIHFNFRVPITGWSSNVQMSNDTDTRVVAARYTATVSGSVSASDTIINYSGSVFDTHGAVTTGASWKFTAPISGYYRFNAQYEASTSGGVVLVIRARKNGTVFNNGTAAVASATNNLVPIVSGTINLNAGDTLDFVSAASGAGGTFVSNTASATVSIERLSGPATIAASETVACLYKPSSAPTGTLSNSLNLVTYNTKIKDSHGSYNSGIFTVPISGQYDVKAQINTLITTAVAGQYHGLAIFIDGSEYFSTFTKIASSSVTEAYPTVSLDNIPLKAGQTIAIYSYMDGTGVTYNTHSVHHALSIKRSGNY